MRDNDSDNYLLYKLLLFSYFPVLDHKTISNNIFPRLVFSLFAESNVDVDHVMLNSRAWYVAYSLPCEHLCLDEFVITKE